MKKRIWLILTAVLIVAAAAAGYGIYRYQKAQALAQSLAQAEQIYRAHSDRYHAALDAVERSTLTVTEDGSVIGVYSLADLGLDEAAKAAVMDAFDPTDRLSKEEYEALTQEEQLAMLPRADFEPEPAPLSLENLDFDPIFADLDAVSRASSVDCMPVFTGTGFELAPEIPGNELDKARVLDALHTAVEDKQLTAEPLSLSFEVTDCDPYIPPKITLENQRYDFNQLAREVFRDKAYALHVDLCGTDVTLDADACAALVEVDEKGALTLKKDKAAELIAGWAEEYDADRVPYCFSSYSAGKVELPFQTVNRRLDQEALLEGLEKALCCLSPETVDAPFACTDRAGREFSISGTYVEVDIARQTMSYFVDGELLVTTPVVTGRPWGHMTPSGYYRIQSKLPDQWLTGPDYSVFVSYWLGFYGSYGIHDARWRTMFGENYYERNGSHGCVNTPTEAMAQIYEHAEVGTPVVVFNAPIEAE